MGDGELGFPWRRRTRNGRKRGRESGKLCSCSHIVSAIVCTWLRAVLWEEQCTNIVSVPVTVRVLSHCSCLVVLAKNLALGLLAVGAG